MIKSNAAQKVLPVVAYLLVALAYTFPLLLHPATHIAGNNGDSFINLWPFWYFPHALMGAGNYGGSLFEPVLQLFPEGINLIYTSNSAIGAMAMSPVAELVGPAAALNVWLLLHLWLGGWFFFRFCKVIGANEGAAFLGGMAYMCSPFVAVHLPGHYTLVQIGYTAGAMWSLAVLLERSSGAIQLGWRQWLGPAVGLGLSTWAVAATDLYLAMMTVMLLLPAVVAHFAAGSGGREAFRTAGFWKAFCTAVVIAVVLVLPWVLLVVAARAEHDYAPFSLEGYSSLVARWSRLVNLPKYHPIWGPLLHEWGGEKMSQFNEYAYLGIVGFFIAGIAFLLGPNRRRMVVWVVAFIVALGLAGANSYTVEPEWRGTPLGFGQWWPRAFPFSEFRVPGRWQFALCTVVAVGLALGTDALLSRSRNGAGRNVAWVLMFGLLAMDLIRYPLPVVEAVPIKSGLDGASAGTVLDVPVGIISGQGYAVGQFENATLMRQMSHGLPVLSASVSRLPVDIIKARQADKELTEFLRVQGGGELTTASEQLDWVGFQRRYQIGMIRIPTDWPTSAALQSLATKMNLPLQWSDDGEALIGR